ncbi:ABC transporter ATP-binding protein [Mitsuaria sp. WAJ17]|uniref:ABC transporter ATP-binding protein n=1 Tax=Mitsuaria sp. WAJ17 TaxID=2761452 RepID=UPI001601BE6D|nr:ABC transporter ATP-binding protein [Mitsuaria sp. WAJ17]MBB2485144.1 ABC transporter ATP-binding protein [Mitsuaria sp. WAJ17]
MLETRNLTIRFGGHVAVDHVSCAFAPGSLTAIVGPNGAGKTTYFNLISGQLPASEGQVLLDGEDLSALSAPLRTREGLGRAFQLTQLFPHLPVLENVRLAVQARQGLGLKMLSVWVNHKALIEESMALLERVRLSSKSGALAASLPHGDQRKLEVAVLMALQPKVYMFDEPTAGMSVDEVPVVLDLIRELKREGRHTILLVEHKMDVVRELADRVIVLHQGALVADGKPAEVMALPVVQEAYLGVAADVVTDGPEEVVA